MFFLSICLAYVAVHGILLMALSRAVAVLRTETGVFLWHLCSLLGLDIVLVVLWLLGLPGTGVSLVVAASALHAMYSMSTLELWSLAQGSYSLRILDDLVSDRLHQHALEAVGGSKKQARLVTLQRLRLVQISGYAYQLTRLGYACVAVLRALKWAADLRDVG